MRWQGTVPYAEALELQRKHVEARRAGVAGDVLLLLEHPAVVTLGRNAREENLRVSRAELRRRGVEVHEVARGGDVTYHGPGQLVGYLVADLQARGEPDVIRCVRTMERALIEALGSLGVEGYTRNGSTGVFATPRGAGSPRKIASIGLGLRGWVTYHGFALNTSLDLRAFDVIVPCGLHDVVMTSLRCELADAPPDLDARARVVVEQSFRRHFEARVGPTARGAAERRA